MARKEDNLIPFTSEQNREEASKNGHKGGIASGVARRKKKTIKQLLNTLMDLPVSAIDKKALKTLGVTEEDDQNNKMLVAVGLMKRAATGDPQAVKLLCELNGDLDEANNNEVESINVNITTVSKDDIDRVNELKKGLFNGN